MKLLIASFLAFLFYPGAASAVVVMHVEDLHVVPNGRDQLFDVEVYATNPDPAENERVNAFTLALEAPTFRPDGGAPRFVIPPDFAFPDPTRHPYFFRNYAGCSPVDPAGLSDYSTVLLSCALGGTGQEANITDTDFNGFGKVAVLVPADTPEGVYPIQFDPAFLSLGSAGAPIVTATESGWVIVGPVPEPATGGSMCAAAALGLLRRRAEPVWRLRHA